MSVGGRVDVLVGTAVGGAGVGVLVNVCVGVGDGLCVGVMDGPCVGVRVAVGVSVGVGNNVASPLYFSFSLHHAE